MAFFKSFIDKITMEDDDIDDYDDYDDYRAMKEQQEREKQEKKDRKKQKDMEKEAARKERERAAKLEEEAAEKQERSQSSFANRSSGKSFMRDTYNTQTPSRFSGKSVSSATSINSTSSLGNTAQRSSAASTSRYNSPSSSTNRYNSFANAAASSSSSMSSRSTVQTPVRILNSTDGSDLFSAKPTKFEDAQSTCTNLLNGIPVILNLECLDATLSQRIMDFICGTLYAIDGSIWQISGYIFLLLPPSVDVSGDCLKRLQSGNNFSIPTLRTQN